MDAIRQRLGATSLVMLLLLASACTESSVLEGRWTQTSSTPIVIDVDGNERFLVLNLGHYGGEVAGFVNFYQSNELLVIDEDCPCWVIRNGQWVKRSGDQQTTFTFEFSHCKKKTFIGRLWTDGTETLTGTITEFISDEPRQPNSPTPVTVNFGKLTNEVPYGERRCSLPAN